MGHRLIKSVRINLGGDTIDEHNGRWFEIWNQLTHDDSMKKAYDEMVGYHGVPGWKSSGQVDGAQTLYIPLQFWFNRNPGLSLPLIALQYHEVKVIFNFEDLSKLVIWPYDSNTTEWHANALLSLENDGPYNGVAASDGNLTNTNHGVLSANWKTALVTAGSEFTANLYVDYIYLDTEERKRFAQMSHEYLIDQLQIHGKETLTSYSHRMRLNFNHPVKELIWVFEPPEGDYITLSNDGDGLNFTSVANLRTGFNTGADVDLNEQVKYRWGNFGEITEAGESDIYEWMKDAKLQINGHDRFSTRPGSYFRRVQPYQFHGGVSDVPIYVYSFALRPEEFQPSGTCNFSRIDNAYLELNLNKFVKPAVYSNATLGQSNGTNTAYGGAPRVPYYSIEATNTISGSSTNIGPGHTSMDEQRAPWSVTTAGKLVQPTWRTGSKLNLYAYAVSYNVLKIVSGRGGLAYSN